MGKWLYNEKNRIFIVGIGISILLLTLVIELLVPMHGHFEFESWPFFFASFGFLACALLVVIAKLLGYWLKRRDDFYENTVDDEDDNLENN